MVYEVLSAVGGLGLLAQTLLGFAHGGHGAGHDGGHAGEPGGFHVHGHVHLHSHALQNVHAHGHLHTATGNTATGGNGQGTSHQHTHTTQHSSGEAKPSPLAPLYSLLSPLALFTICLGVGVTGLLLQLRIHEQLLVALGASIGGLALYLGLVRPLWEFIFQFASKPAATLSAAVAQEAEADSRFGPDGKGIVRLTVDGQLVRILAQLESDDQSKGVTVTTGDKLVVTQIDRQRNTCHVTRL